MDAIGSTTKPIYIDNNGVAKPIQIPNAGIVGTDANSQMTKKKLSTSTGSVSKGTGSVSPTKDTWTFEALDGTTTTKDVVTDVTGTFVTSVSGTFVTGVSVVADA
jgi:hypothetical protein